jgi:nitrogen fixation/metabolism regulation signal transduction histidine kinase
VTRALRYLLVVAAAVVCILLFLLASASDNATLFDEYYSWILGANVTIAGALLVLVCVLLGRLYSRYRSGRFGSRLMTKLVLLFAVIGILPGSVIYLVSVQFVSRSIESWFNVKVESALESGLNLGRVALDASLNDIRAKARGMAGELSEVSDATIASHLPRLLEHNQLQDAVVVSGHGDLIASASSGTAPGHLVPELPAPSMLARARTMGGFGVIEGESESTGKDLATNHAEVEDKAQAAGLRLRVVVAIRGDGSLLSLRSQTRYLQILQPVPQQLAENAEALRVAYGEYQQRSLARSGLRKFYLVTLTLTLLLAIFAAIVSAFLLATDLARPLLLLAEGTKAVAEGNLSPRPIVAGTDELGTLTQSFNTMTRQLADARGAVERNRLALEDAKAYLESVLANMSAGVMVLDSHLRLITFNASVERILHYDLTPYLGQPFAAVTELAVFSQHIIQAFSEQSAQTVASESNAEGQHWQQQIEIDRRMVGQAAEGQITLFARGSRLPVESGTGHVVVFDDISDIISGQRSIAWAEVARRLAHEIKNPLTPIQLSAERLQMKLQSKLDAGDAALLDRSTNTIVNQVTAMQRMVDNFRDYAKTPAPVLAPLDLNALIMEILDLYVGGDDSDIIHPKLAPDLPKILGDATQLRQVVHNLLQNAQDATTDTKGSNGRPHIDILTEAIHYPAADGAMQTAVRLSIADNGPGFDSKLMARAFEPYVTSKPRGTGLGLPVVKKIIEEHGGRIELQNRKESNGAKVLILLLKLGKN